MICTTYAYPLCLLPVFVTTISPASHVVQVWLYSSSVILIDYFFFTISGVENAEGGGGGGSGHKASFRGANKLARRARSFKEDLLERISAMRSPGAPSTHTALPSLRYAD